MRIIVLSDIHANLTALTAVIEDFNSRYAPDGLILLGDIINYGMRPDETIMALKRLSIPILVNIHGNHENALISGNLQRFSTERGKKMLDYTRNKLSKDSLDYILNNMNTAGKAEIEIDGKRLLCVHGNADDSLWGNLNCDSIKENTYSQYDYVLSGHSHLRHYIESFYPTDNPEYRNKKKTVFLNPGSVGQPRNHNACAQYAYIDTSYDVIHLNSVPYDIVKEQKLYISEIDVFYKTRLEKGI